MINVINLIWIIPLSITCGMLVMAFFKGATKNNKDYEIYQEGYRAGYIRAKNEEKHDA